jgi:hypothetical protein
MNLERLHEILKETTVQLRKGPMVAEEGMVTTVMAMPHVDEAGPELEVIDLVLLAIGVHREKAAEHRAELDTILASYKHPELIREVSYIEMGAIIGSQGAAFQLFALGKVLGFWQILTPLMFGATGRAAEMIAAQGMITIHNLKRKVA